jgi:tyrosine-protein kinase Etk/Wzc
VNRAPLTPWPARRIAQSRKLASRPESLDPPGLRSAGSFLSRRKWTILGCLAAVVLAAAILTLVWPESYRSTTTVLIERQRGERPDTPALAALERVGRASVIETETELIQSRRVLEPVVDSLDIHVRVRVADREARPDEVFPVFVADRSARPGEYRVERRETGFVAEDSSTDAVLATAPAGGELVFAGLQLRLPSTVQDDEIAIEVESFATAVNRLLDSWIEVAPIDREGDILRISCTGPSAESARALCEHVADSYVALRSELQRSDASATAQFLAAQVARLGDSLAVAEDHLEAFKKREQVVALNEQASEEVRQYAQLKAQRDLVEAERSALAGTLRRIEASPGDARRYRELVSFPAFLGNQTIGYLLQAQAQLETQRAELARRRTEQNPELATLDGRIAAIDRQLGSIASEYERSLAAQVHSLERALGGSSGRLSSYPERQVESARLEREVASIGAIYTMLEARLREAEVAAAVHQSPVQILDLASLPGRPASPNPKVNLLLALVLGLGFGLAVALAREYADTKIHDRRSLERKTALPILAMIPTIRRPGPVLPVTLTAEDEPVAQVQPSSGVTPASDVSGLPVPARPVPAPVVRAPAVPARNVPGRVAFPALGGALRRRLAVNGYAPAENVALEVFRSLGADLQFVARKLPKGDLRSLAITSAGRGEGKTYVACNLALARASFGVHTLLIDADMRARGVAPFLDLDSPTPGLSDLLAGRVTAREARRTLRVDGGDALSVMPAGEATADAAELLDTAYFEAMLAGAQAVYDLVIIDTPPLNVLADAAAVAASVDAVLVVVREGVTDGDSLELTLERLERAGGNVAGIVLNDVRLPKQYAAYGYTYAQ